MRVFWRTLEVNDVGRWAQLSDALHDRVLRGRHVRA